jgi:hypothetical protein
MEIVGHGGCMDSPVTNPLAVVFYSFENYVLCVFPAQLSLLPKVGDKFLMLEEDVGHELVGIASAIIV